VTGKENSLTLPTKGIDISINNNQSLIEDWLAYSNYTILQKQVHQLPIMLRVMTKKMFSPNSCVLYKYRSVLSKLVWQYFLCLGSDLHAS
jgi:hypothetical protein